MKELATFPPFIRGERCRGRRENRIIAIALANQRLNSRHSAANPRKLQGQLFEVYKAERD